MLPRLFQRGPRARRVERVQDPREADLRVLEALRELGCDPAEPRSVRHFLYVPGRRDADEVCEALAREDWQTSVQDCGGACLVVVARSLTLSEPVVRRTRARLEALAAEHGGRYDGWEVETE